MGEKRTWRVFPRSIRGILLFLLVLAILPILVLQTGIYYSQYQKQVERTRRHTFKLLRSTALTFQTFFQDIARRQSTLGIGLIALSPYSTEQANTYLALEAENHPAIRAFHWVDPNGRILASSRKQSIGKDLPRKTFVQDILNGRESVVTNLVKSEITGEWFFGVCRGIRDSQGELKGIVVAEVPINLLNTTTLEFQKIPEDGIMVTDRNGRLVYQYPQSDLPPEQSNADPSFPPLLQASAGQEEAVLRYADHLTDHSLFSMPIQSIGWMIHAGKPGKDILAPFLHDLIRNSILLFLVYSLTLLLALVLIRRIVNPLRQLQEYALAIGEGNFDRKAAIFPVIELANLARAFNHMAEGVRSHEREIKQAREEAEKRAREAEEGKRLLEALMENVPEGIAIIEDSPDAIVEMISQYGLHMLGEHQTPFVRKPFLDYINGWNVSHDNLSAYDNYTLSPIYRSTQNGEIIKNEKWELETPEGRWIPILINAGPIRDHQGQVTGCILVWRDVSDRERMMEALHQERDFSAAVLNTAGALVVVLDPEGRIVTFNKACETITGYSFEEVRGRNMCDFLLVPEEMEKVRETLRDMKAGQFPQKVDNYWLTRDGTRKLIRWSNTALLDAEGEVKHIIKIGIDITEQFRLMHELRRIVWLLTRSGQRSTLAQDRYMPQPYGDLTAINTRQMLLKYIGQDVLIESLADSLDLLESSAAVYETNGECALNLVCSGWCRFLDQASRSLCDTPDNRQAMQAPQWLCHQSCRVQVSRIAIDTGQSAEIECPGGLNVYAVPIWASGEVVGAISISYGDPPTDPAKISEIAQNYQVDPAKLRELAREYESRPPFIIDIAQNRLLTTANLIGAIIERQQAEEALQKINDELEHRVRERTAELARSNAELEQFAYVASHDLQEPLRMVASYVQLLKRRYAEKLDGSALEFIDFAVDGAGRMQKLIQDLLAYSRVGTRGKPFEKVETQALLQRALDNLKLTIQETNTTITYDILPKIIVDETQIAQLFQNLIENGIKFRKAGDSRIHIAAEREPGGWRFGVRDNGIGINSDYFDRIFVIFQRLHTRQKYPGTGMGLAICKRIVERHGGRIWVESVPGQGSVFYFTIPDTQEGESECPT